MAPSKVAVVTGSNSGIGKETARELVGKGFHVVLACRSKDKAETAIAHIALMQKLDKAEDHMTFLPLDTANFSSVKAFAKSFLGKFDRLDVLVHNAGTGYLVRENRVTEDKLEGFFQTNYLGPFLLSKLLLDVLKKSSGRVVCVTSIEHWEGSYDFEKATQKTGPVSYPTSKLMMCLHAFELRRRHGITAVAVNPGGVQSNIWWYLRGWRKTVYEFVSNLVLLTSEQGCKTSVHAATAETLPDGPVYLSPYKQMGLCPHRSDYLNFYNGPNEAQADPRVYNEAVWKQLWEFSDKVRPFL